MINILIFTIVILVFFLSYQTLDKYFWKDEAEYRQYRIDTLKERYTTHVDYTDKLEVYINNWAPYVEQLRLHKMENLRKLTHLLNQQAKRKYKAENRTVSKELQIMGIHTREQLHRQNYQRLIGKPLIDVRIMRSVRKRINNIKQAA